MYRVKIFDFGLVHGGGGGIRRGESPFSVNALYFVNPYNTYFIRNRTFVLYALSFVGSHPCHQDITTNRIWY